MRSDMLATWLMTIPAQAGDSLWLPEQASTFAETVDGAWALVYWISIFFFVLVVAIQAIFMWKYRRRPGWTEQKTPHHNYPLELTWSIAPSLLIVVMFVKGFIGFLDMRTPPANTYDINVVAQKWSWQFEYPEGYTDPQLHVPVDTNVKLIMASNDVIHSLYIDAFRVKQDVVPGRYNYLWFNATKPGEFHLQCTEYCGRNHSDMRSTVFVHEAGGMDEFFKRKEDELFKTPPLELGEKLYTDLGCVQCHALDATTKVGPGFAQTFDTKHTFANNEDVKSDENYIRESILNPQLHVRKGFPTNMPTFKGRLKEPEIHALVGFIKSQNPKFKKQAQQEFAKPLPPPEGDAGADAAGGDAADGDADAPALNEPAGPGDEGGEPETLRE
jgi:cytochrome c oxidase subunit 2